jgi:hypothetical protein
LIFGQVLGQGLGSGFSFGNFGIFGNFGSLGSFGTLGRSGPGPFGIIEPPVATIGAVDASDPQITDPSPEKASAVRNDHG